VWQAIPHQHRAVLEEVLLDTVRSEELGEAASEGEDGGMSKQSLYGGVTMPGRPDMGNIRALDLLSINTLRRMHRLGTAIDIPHLKHLGHKLRRLQDETSAEIMDYIPREKLSLLTTEDALNLDSPDQVAELLFNVLKLPTRDLKMTPSGARVSTGKKQLEKLRENHPIIPKVLAYREYSKLETMTVTILGAAKIHPRGKNCPLCGMRHRRDIPRVHTKFSQTRADTGRMSSSDPVNLQNVPVRTELGREIRAAFIAEEGYQLVTTDFSQIELRLMAHCSQEPSMLRAYRENLDIHTLTASETYNVPYDEVTPEQRLPSKNVNFGVAYGLSPPGLWELLATMGVRVTVEECAKFISRWFEVRPGMWRYMVDQRRLARRYGYVWDLFGRIKLIPEVSSCHERVQADGDRKAGNQRITATAAGMMKLALGEMHDVETAYRDTGHYCEPLLTVHDELVQEVDESIAEDVAKQTRVVFANCCPLSVPVDAESKVMERWKK